MMGRRVYLKNVDCGMPDFGVIDSGHNFKRISRAGVHTALHDLGPWNIGYRSQSYVYITPKYLRTYLNWLWNTFRYPIVLTEFGFPEFGESTKKDLSDQLFDSLDLA
ncbi:hypothetical protein INS49_015406 [Diaporthe citri]|uniref:uncharacterized protein n=1 Tax=Diaporthe citri TaxID=83186 RepID=UPI001C80EF33|nr:uncharacterized protein INS49_015406 [Diaporthe citri]KAG6356021.1 hypothetical protein INS49_015406 [Diaporthe citri]